jgi:hypothetical protein
MPGYRMAERDVGNGELELVAMRNKKRGSLTRGGYPLYEALSATHRAIRRGDAKMAS